DFAFNNTNTIQSNNQGTALNEFARLRKAYGTFAGFEGGLDVGIAHDGDSDPELIDGDATFNGRLRQGLVKYTYAGPYGTVFTVGGENPDSTISTVFGKNDIDTNSVPNIAPCSVTGNTLPNLPVNTACTGAFSFFSAQEATMPEWAATARVNQPWGHLQLGSVLRDQVLDDGQYYNSRILGYVGTLSGDVHPFSGNPGPLGKDDLGFMFAGGSNTGNQIGNGNGTATNFGATLNVAGVGFVNPQAQTAGTACSGGTVALSSGACPAGTTSSTAAWNERDANQGALTSGAFINGVNVRSAYDSLVRTQAA